MTCRKERDANDRPHTALGGECRTHHASGYFSPDGITKAFFKPTSLTYFDRRSREEIELVFDRNKSAIHALYSRALRDNPALQGKVVLEVTIAPSGDVTDVRLVSSELGDPDLERKLVARVKMFKFEAKDVVTMTTTKPIEFFPA